MSFLDTFLDDFLVVEPPFSGAPALSGDAAVSTTGTLLAFTTLAKRRSGGSADFRLGADAGKEARGQLEAALAPLELSWLNLEHGAAVVEIPQQSRVHADNSQLEAQIPSRSKELRADAGIVGIPGHAVAFTTADCLPVVIASTSRGFIAGIHAGWRGLARGVLENTCKHLAKRCGGTLPRDTQAWIGPCIGAVDYEIDADTRAQLLQSTHVCTGHFSPTKPGHYLADLPALASAQLRAAGIATEHLSLQPGSSFSSTCFHSARRDGSLSGRMATVAGILPVQ